jgi:hypothetical protein
MLPGLEEGRQQNERMNGMSFVETMKVHRIASSNMVKKEFVEQQKG